MSSKLLNAQVLVIGGSSGIGLATAVAAADEGASVTIASRSKSKLDAALGSIRENSRAVVLDTQDQSALERLFMAQDPWDHVVVSAAQTPTGSVRALSLADAVLQGAINAALEALARGLALELAPVRVNAVSPGVVATPLWSSMAKEKREAMFAGASASLPAGRIGLPEDIANAVLFLATTPYATGSTVRVDGGGAIA